MAEINPNQAPANGNKKTGFYTGKKLSTRVDLTPMVDLGFLLITFFIFTNSMKKPMVLKLNLPASENATSNVGQNQVITIFLTENNTIKYYFGKYENNMQTTHFGPSGIRQILIEKRKLVAEKYKNPNNFTVLIKPTDKAIYQNVVDILDEMMINEIKTYMLLDVTDTEMQLLAKNS